MMRTSEIGRKINKLSVPALAILGGIAVVQHLENRQLKGRNHHYEQRLQLLEKANEELYRQKQGLERTSDIDELTKLPRRRTVLETFKGLQEAYQRSQQEGWHASRRSDSASSPLDHVHALVLLDIDDFGAFNKTRGENYGDTILEQVAGALSGNTRRNDLAFRWGGEELGVLLPRTTMEDAMAVAGKIHAAVGATGKVTASLGVGWVQLDSPFETSIEMADLALREAKSSGKNQIVQFTPDRHHLLKDF